MFQLCHVLNVLVTVIYRLIGLFSLSIITIKPWLGLAFASSLHSAIYICVYIEGNISSTCTSACIVTETNNTKSSVCVL